MDNESRLFDFLQNQLINFPKPDMLNARAGGQWIAYPTVEVAKKVDDLSAALLQLGLSGHDMQVENQDKIAVISRNRPEWQILDLACQQIGVALCPIYPTTNLKEIEFIFNDAQVKAVFYSGEDILEKIESVNAAVPSLKHIITFDADQTASIYWETLLTPISDIDLKGVEDIKKTINAAHCATIIYTSGTTGTPKGVMLSHRNIVSNVLNAVASFPFEKNTERRALSFLPLNHIFERMVSYIYLCCGISIYYAQSLETIADDMKEVKPHLFTTVPRLLEKVYEKIMSKGSELSGIKKKLFDWAVRLGLKFDIQDKGSLTYRLQLALANKIIFNKWREGLGGKVDMIVSGGAACQVRLIRIFTAAGIPIFEGYGPTENSPVITVNCIKEGGRKFGSVGPVIQGQEVKIMPDGEICVKGPSVMMGYYKRPDLTEETIIDGWLHTGDIGVWEEEIFLKITDRKKELFKTSGGKYVAPQVIENKMKESNFVEQIMVVGAGEKFVGALIVPSAVYLKDWMQHKEIAFTNLTDAIHHPAVLALFKDIVESFNKDFNHVEQVKKFELIPEEWSIESGEMTPKLSLKRKVIMEKFKSAIGNLYR